MPRPQLSVFIACSVDGYIATRDGHLNWLDAAAKADEDYGWDRFIASVDALAMGRGTYDHIADVDPWPFAGKQVFGFTHRPPAARDGVTFWSVSPAEAVAHWTEVGLRRVYVDGGHLISAFSVQYTRTT
jgi:dihydrofolate reductase